MYQNGSYHLLAEDGIKIGKAWLWLCFWEHFGMPDLRFRMNETQRGELSDSLLVNSKSHALCSIQVKC